MKFVRQILAIARTEFRFGFRRSAPVVVTALIGLIVGAGALIPAFVSLSGWAANSIMTPEKVERLASFGLTPDEWALFLREAMSDMFVFSTLMAWLLILLALLFLPMATSASIPADRKFGVSDLLRSTPITGSVYLAGKILGTLATVLMVGVSMLGLFFIISEITLFSTLHYGLSASASWFLIKIAFMDGLHMLVWGTTVGVLVGIFFRSRRAAIFPGILTGVASLIGWVVAFRAPAKGVIGVTDLAYYYLLQNYRTRRNAPAFRHGDVRRRRGAPKRHLTIWRMAV